MIGTILLGVLICMAAGIIPQLFIRSSVGLVIKYFLIALVGNLIMIGLLVYFFMPPLIGPLGGFQFLIAPLIVNLLVGLLIASANNDYDTEDDQNINAAAATGNGILALLIVLIMAIVGISTTWGNANAKERANFLPIENVEESFVANTDTPEIFPDTDPQHIALVEEPVAQYIGSRALGQTGENLGSIYKPGGYTQVSVQGRVYQIAPIIYQNFFANLKNQTSPGYILVDGENPNAPSRLVMDYQLKYLPEAMFNQDLIRHLYLNGWSNYRLIDPTMEVDDNWVPYFTVDAATYQKGFYGTKVVKTLVVNSLTGEIQAYDISDKPDWVDRVLPIFAVDKNIDDYGRFYKSKWINFSGAGIEIRADNTTPTAYSSSQSSPVYQYVMSSKNSTDFSSLGVILVNSDDYVARRFPIYGIIVGSKVNDAFLNVSDNVVGTNEYKMQITGPVLYNIYDRLTWVTTYTTPPVNGMAEFKEVGLVDAYNVASTNVIKAKTLEEALRQYKLWIANPPSNTVDPTQTSEPVTVTGNIVFITPEVQNSFTVYYFMIRGEDGAVSDYTFMVNPTDDVNEIRFTEAGDPVTFTYLDNGDKFGSVGSFDNLSIPPQ